MHTLEVTTRDVSMTSEDLRNKGMIPAVFYGPKEEATPIAINAKAFTHLFKEAGETTIIKLSGVGDEKDTLIHDVQHHPVTGAPLHADFYVLEKGKKITIKVPLEFVGVALAEKAGHILVKALHELEIEVAPAELPQHLPVDISHLENVGDHVVAKDVTLPPSARLLEDADEIVASVTEVKKEVEAPVAAASAEAVPASASEDAKAA